MVLLLLVACRDPALTLVGDAAAGAPNYDAQCTRCHGPLGEGSSRGPPLTGLAERQAPSISLQILRDGTLNMPAYDGRFSDQEFADLLAWVHAL